jgi:hypothetical protein
MLSNFAAVDLFAMPSLANGDARAHRVPCVLATDVTPEDFIAFHCDGAFGIHIDPSIWHQPVFPVGPNAVFDDKQGRVHACVAVDFIREFGWHLKVPLLAPR